MIYHSTLTSISSDNGLAPTRRQIIIRTNAGILLTGPLGVNFSEILALSFKEMHLKVSQGKMTAILSRPQCVNIIDINSWLIVARWHHVIILSRKGGYFTKPIICHYWIQYYAIEEGSTKGTVVIWPMKYNANTLRAKFIIENIKNIYLWFISFHFSKMTWHG